MSRKKTRSAPSRPSDRSHPGKPEGRTAKDRSVPPGKNQSAKPGAIASAAMWRETIESIVIAFVLAFLFRTFEAEAFVIPTGSMAPTLMGRHKDLLCEQCGYPFRVSASDEVDSQTNRRSNNLVVGCTCPMCRYTMDVSSDNAQGETYKSYKGDRILVGKFPYQYCDPERWDVTVFKYPGGAKTNFIKRIVGLPNETLRISHGDIFTMKNGEDVFSIEQKPSAKVRAMLQMVYDNDYARGVDDSLGRLLDQGWPARWSGLSLGENPGGWETTDHVSFQADGSAADTAWLEYRHIVPSDQDWEYLAEGQLPPGELRNNPQLITDFCGYNTDVVGSAAYSFDTGRPPEPSPDKMGLHWVGDLAVECRVEIGGNTGQVLFDLIEGGQHFRCTIDVATGTATLEIPGCPDFGTVTAADVISGPGKYRIMFANVDDKLRLWVGSRVVEFNGDGDYSLLGLDTTKPRIDDLSPVRIGSRGTALHVSHLKIHRDIYYIAVKNSSGRIIADFSHYPWPYTPMNVEQVARVLSDPGHWEHFGASQAVSFDLGEGQFLALGDNSAESKDSRLWGGEGYEHYVERELLIGKAIWIYWPHSLDKIPGTEIPIRLFPNFWRMWFVE